MRIKEDKWLSGSPNCPITSPLPSVAAETKVQTLINLELGCVEIRTGATTIFAARSLGHFGNSFESLLPSG